MELQLVWAIHKLPILKTVSGVQLLINILHSLYIMLKVIFFQVSLV